MTLQHVHLTQEATPTSSPTNHIIVVDCSGSMYSELPKIRQHLKSKIPTLVQPLDTLTIIWFSGRNQFGILFEGVAVNGLTDLSAINTTIDRYLTTVGATGFKQPLEEVKAVTKRLTATQHSMLFLSDGYDNAWSKQVILEACSALSGELVSAAFVEYGFYADHELLSAMSEELGGSLVRASDFSDYAFQLDNLKTLSFGTRIQITVSDFEHSKQFVVGHTPTGFVIAKPVNGVVSLPSNVVSYSYFDNSISATRYNIDTQSACGVIAALIQRGMADEAIELAGYVGDVSLYRNMENAFSKQDLMRVADHAESLAIGTQQLYKTTPRAVGLAPANDAYNVLELLMDLSATPGNQLMLSHPEFVYKTIGQRHVNVAVNEFTPVFTDQSDTVIAEIANLTFDSDRPNVSILVKRTGSVSLPVNNFGFGDQFGTYIWRNYAIIRDGIVNVSKLPVVLTKQTHTQLVARGLALDPFKVGQVHVIDVSAMPVINRTMVAENSLTGLCNLVFQEHELKCRQKYAKTLLSSDSVAGSRFVGLYGEEATLFLKEYGITDGGFSPKTVSSEESSDEYTAKLLTVKMTGLSGIPIISDMQKAIAAKKRLNTSQTVLATAIAWVDAKLATKDTTPESIVEALKQDIKAIKATIVKIKFGVIVGRKWFTDSEGYDDTIRQMKFGTLAVACEAKLVDKLV